MNVAFVLGLILVAIVLSEVDLSSPFGVVAALIAIGVAVVAE